jgi:hypothetical protein
VKFLSLLGKQLKDDDVLDVLESLEIEVVYDFDRLHENTPDKYWATCQKEGFCFRFDHNQVLQNIFLYVAPHEGFTPVARDCDVLFFSSADEVERHGGAQNLRVSKGKRDFLGKRSDWVRLEHDGYSVHYEFTDQLTKVTLTKMPRSA